MFSPSSRVTSMFLCMAINVKTSSTLDLRDTLISNTFRKGKCKFRKTEGSSELANEKYWKILSVRVVCLFYQFHGYTIHRAYIVEAITRFSLFFLCKLQFSWTYINLALYNAKPQKRQFTNICGSASVQLNATWSAVTCVIVQPALTIGISQIHDTKLICRPVLPLMHFENFVTLLLICWKIGKSQRSYFRNTLYKE